MTDTERRDGRISPPPLSPAREPLALGAFITGPGLGDSNGSTPVRDGFSPRARMINKDKENDREKDKEKVNPSKEEKKKRKKLQKELGKLKKLDKDKKKKRKGDKEKDKEKEKEPRRTIVLPPLEDSNVNGLSDPDVKRVVNPVYGMGARVKKLNLRYNATTSPASSPRDDTPLVIISVPEKNGHETPEPDNSSPRKGVSFNDTPITFVPKDPPLESIVKGLSRSDDNSWKRQALLNKGVVVRSPAASPSASPKVSTALSSSDDNHTSRIRRSLTAGPSTSSSSPSLPSLQEILGDEPSKDNGGGLGGDLKVKGNAAERRASSLNSEAGRISSGRPKSMNVNTTLAGIEDPRRVEKKKDINWKMRALTGKGVMAESSEKYNEPFSRLSVLMSIVDIPKTERESLLSGSPTPSTHNNNNNGTTPEVSQRLPRTTPSTTAYLLDGKRTWNGLPGKGRHIKIPTKKIPQTPRGTSSTTTTTPTTPTTTFNAQRLKTVKTVASEAVQELMEELEGKKKELREVDVTITEEEVGEFLSRVDEIIAFLKSED